MKRGEVWWADLEPRSGSEQGGRRPVIVVSHDGFNDTPTWRSVIVVPLSRSPAQARRGPTAVPIAPTGSLRTPGVALCHQVTTLDRAKLESRAGILEAADLTRLAAGLRVALDLG